MLRQKVFLLLTAVVLSAICGTLVQAQTPAPTVVAGVRGSGGIHVGRVNVGMFNINVADTGSALIGGFQYREVSPIAARPVCEIISKNISILHVVGNAANVVAVGSWNGLPARIVIDVVDDNRIGDGFRIHAETIVPAGSLVPSRIYDAAGVVFRGDIVVFAPPTSIGAAKGEGTIAVGANTGKFAFVAERSSAGVKGSVNYAELLPTTGTGPIARPKAVIYMPVIESMTFIGANTALIKGKGTLNGRPALIEARAVDAGPLADSLDQFFIKATPLLNATTPGPAYEAGGPVTSGNLVVVAPK